MDSSGETAAEHSVTLSGVIEFDEAELDRLEAEARERFVARLNQLIDACLPIPNPGPDADPAATRSYRQARRPVEIKIGQAAKRSKEYLYSLGTGQDSNPTLSVMSRIAAFFGVPVTVFLSDDAGPATRVAEDLRKWATYNPKVLSLAEGLLSSPQAAALARTVAELPPDTQDATATFLNTLLGRQAPREQQD